jgi:replicative DNA helicase
MLRTNERGFNTIDEQVDYLRDFAANPKQRLRSGIRSLDMMTEGPAAGEVYMFMGRSYSGKSQVATNVMANNPEEHIMFFSLEMPARQALQRLYSTAMRVDHSEIMSQTKSNTISTDIDLLAAKLPYQIIVDTPALTLGDMTVLIDQYDGYFGQRPLGVIVDYLELVAGGTGEGWQRTESVAKRMKDWAKEEEIAVFLLHQTNRSEPQWEPPVADSARGAGFTESDVVIGMWQPGTNPKLGDLGRQALRRKLYFNVLKNRITGRTTNGVTIEALLEPSLQIVDMSEEQTKRFFK